MAPVEKVNSLLPSQQPTIKVEKRTDRSAYMWVLQHMLKPFSTSIVTPRKIYPAGSPQLEPHKKAQRLCNIKERQVEGIYIYDITAKDAYRALQGDNHGKIRMKRIYFFCGGGWQIPASSEHWALCAEIAVQLANTIVSLVSYPLAPNTPAPVAFPWLAKMHETILREAEDAGEDVILAGDSAGGNIALCLPLYALHQNPKSRVPIAILVISPSTDLRRHNPDIKVIEKHDPILRIPFINHTAKKWRGEWDPTDPRVSPLYADVVPLARRGVQVHGIVGRYDILGPDAILMREKCNQVGVKGEWLDWEKQMHCFPLTWSFHLPEGVYAKNWMLDVLRRS